MCDECELAEWLQEGGRVKTWTPGMYLLTHARQSSVSMLTLKSDRTCISQSLWSLLFLGLWIILLWLVMAKGRSANGAEFGRYTLPIILNLPLPTFTFAHILSYTPGMKDDSISRTSYSNLLSMNNPTQLICICITFKPCIHSFVLTVGQTSASLYSLEGVFFKWDPLKVSIDR